VGSGFAVPAQTSTREFSGVIMLTFTRSMVNGLKGAPAWVWAVIMLAGLGVEAYTARVEMAQTEAEAARLAADAEAEAEGAEAEAETVRALSTVSERELATALRDTQRKAGEALLAIQQRLADLDRRLTALETQIKYLDRDVERLFSATGGLPTVTPDDVRAAMGIAPGVGAPPQPVEWLQPEVQFQDQDQEQDQQPPRTAPKRRPFPPDPPPTREQPQDQEQRE
jgi:hypothetical protein